MNMTDEENKKILSQLIEQILEDEDNLNIFIFFLNRVENTDISNDVINQILKNYLCICKNESVKGKQRVRHIGDRHVFHCKENVGFIDVNKIELIATAVLNKTSVRLPITIHDFKRKYKKIILKNVKSSIHYKSLMKEYQDGDEIIEVVSSRLTWKQLCGRSGIILKRDDEKITGIMKSMN